MSDRTITDELAQIMVDYNVSAELAGLLQRGWRASAHVRRELNRHPRASLEPRTAEAQTMQSIFMKALNNGRVPGFSVVNARPEAIEQQRMLVDRILNEVVAAGLDGLLDETMQSVRPPPPPPPSREQEIMAICALERVPELTADFISDPSMTIDRVRGRIFHMRALADEALRVDTRRAVIDNPRNVLDRAVAEANAKAGSP